MPSIALLPILAIHALLALATAAILLTAGVGTPQLAAHLGLALGLLPLILAAMFYFVPVLTRGTRAGTLAAVSPLLAWGGGTLAVWAFANDFPPALLSAGAALAGLGASTTALWLLRRARAMLGPRHPGLDWYLAALGFLLLALAAVLLMPVFPAHRAALRLVHLHANLLGFVGLTALGTLQVLLPTCLGQPAPNASQRLRRDLKWAAGGALLVTIGVAPAPTFEAGIATAAATDSAATSAALWATMWIARGSAVLGALGMLWAVVRMLRDTWRYADGALLRAHGAAPSLAAAAAGLGALLLLGIAHGAGLLPPRPAVAGFVVAFLLPLVSGAAAQLLPTWCRPGAQTKWHRALRTRLSRWGGLRGLGLLLLGLLLTVGL